MNALGFDFLIILKQSVHNLPLGSSKPFFDPATDHAWQGTPPTTISALGELLS